MKIIVVIPARFSSKRLPGKPLKKIKGIPMILRTYFQCNKVFKKKQIIVATDDLKVKKLCLKNDINVLMTSKKCLTGTDRVAEVAKKIIADVYINVQGDEPFFNPAASNIKLVVGTAVTASINAVVPGAGTTSVFDGQYITGDIDQDYLNHIDRLRNDSAKSTRENAMSASLELHNQEENSAD